MIQPMYKKGNRLAWAGFLLSIFFGILAILGTPMGGNEFLVPSLQPLAPYFQIARLASIAIIIWGSVLALKSKNRSLWWLLPIVPGLFAGGAIIFVVLIFILKDKSVVAPVVPASVTRPTTPA